MDNSRRDFLKKTALATAGFSIVPSAVISGLGYRAPSDKLNIAGIGVGGKGHPNLVGMNTENIITTEVEVCTSYTESAYLMTEFHVHIVTIEIAHMKFTSDAVIIIHDRDIQCRRTPNTT